MTLHRIGRRSFLHDLGRGTMAVAVFGTAVVACGDDDDPGASAESTTTGPSTTRAASRGDSLRWERVNLGFVSAFVLVRGSTAAIVDTGTAGSVGDISGVLDVLDLGWSDVAHVILTHAHGDHVGSVKEVLVEAAAASVHAGAADIPSIDAGRTITEAVDESEIFGLRVIATPGHTDGHISVYDPTTRLLVAGDALNGDNGSVVGANPDFSNDMAAAAASARRLAALEVDTILFGHGEPIPTGADPLLDALVAG